MDQQPHRQRREALVQRLRAAGGGLAVIGTAPPRRRNGSDNDHPFRPASPFHYLTGFSEPGSWLVVDAEAGRHTLFVQPRNPERELWDGPLLGVDAAPGTLGVDAALPADELNARVVDWLARQPALWTIFGCQESMPTQPSTWIESARLRGRRNGDGPAAHRDLAPLLDEMRLFKDPHEVAAMRRAGEISAAAHCRAMRACRPGMREYELDAELLYEFRRHGAAGPAYQSVVAAGPNACVLHYPAGEAELKAGELCLIDAGCEWQGYASDITRTFPVDGRFSGPQRAIYELVLAAQEAAIAATRPGARKIEAHWAAARTITDGLLQLKLLDASKVGGLDDALASGAYNRFFMHGTGHWLGLDVHDVGSTLEAEEEPVEQPDGFGGRVVRRPSRRLQPGMVVTVEPGCYVRPADDIDPRFWNIGVRIEDDALVTAGGCELLSRGVPVAPDDIEALMRHRAG